MQKTTTPDTPTNASLLLLSLAGIGPEAVAQVEIDLQALIHRRMVDVVAETDRRTVLIDIQACRLLNRLLEMVREIP